MSEKHTHGGNRVGAGRPSEYGENCIKFTVRCPISKKTELKKFIRTKLNSYKLPKN